MKLRRLIYFVIIVGLGALLLVNLGQLRDFFHILSQANLAILITILLARYLYYWSNAQYFISTFKLFGGKITLRRALEASIVYNFLNTVVPSGGVSGTSYIASEFRDEVKASVATAVQIAWYIFTFIGYFMVLFIGLLFLFLSNQLERVSFRVVLIVITLAAVGAIIAAAIAMNYELTKKVTWKLFKPINWILRRFKKQPISRDQLNNFLEEIYHSFRLLLSAKAKLWRPLWYCFLGVAAEILSIYIVFLSLGRAINPGIVIAGYSLAMMASFSAIISSGVGVYEAVMSATFVALGESFSTSFAVVIIYRFVAMWLFIPLGLYIYRHHSKRRERHGG